MFEILWQLLVILSGATIGYLVFTKSYSKALKFLISVCIIYYFISTKLLAMVLIQPFLVKPSDSSASIIVCLGSNIEDDRILKALSLAEEKHLPVIFSGIRKDSVAIIQNFKNIKSIFELNSKSTYENVKNSVQLLRDLNVKKIYLVTSEPHMYRAKKVFEKFHIKVLPKTARAMNLKINFMSFVPRLKYFVKNNAIIYEYFALGYYKVMGKI